MAQPTLNATTPAAPTPPPMPPVAPPTPAALREDGPTVAEYVKAGYLAKNYPPSGYASKSTEAEIAEAIKQPAPHAAPDFHLDTSGPTPPPAPAMVTVKLARNYRPSGHFDIVGYWKPEVKVKDTAGREKIISAAEFIKGEGAPPPQAGVGSATKIWAGTVLKLTKDEAKTVRTAGIGTVEIDDD